METDIYRIENTLRGLNFVTTPISRESRESRIRVPQRVIRAPQGRRAKPRVVEEVKCVLKGFERKIYGRIGPFHHEI